MNLLNSKNILMGRWKLVRIEGKDKTNIKVKDLYIDTDVNKYKQVVKYYNDLINEGKNTSYAALKGILCGKSISSFNLKNNTVMLELEKEPFFFDKMPKLKIDLNTPDLKDDKVEILDSIITNYNVSRKAFLEDSLKDDTAIYKVSSKSKKSSYDKNDNIYQFNLFIENDLQIGEDLFLYDMIDMVLNNSNDIAYLDYNIVATNNNKVIYYATFVTIEIDGKKIIIDLLDSNQLETIFNKIDDHNKKIEKECVKVKRRIG